MSKPNSNYSPEFRSRAVRMLLEHKDEHRSEWAAMQAIASKPGCTGETLRKWVRESEQANQSSIDLTSKERERLKALERENLELRRAKEILRKASAYGGTRPPTEAMIRFIDDHRVDYGVESICQPLPLSVSTYYWYKEREQQPEKIAARVKRDQQLMSEIRRIWDENEQVYGARKVWLQLNREGIQVARCTVERLMKQLGIQGVSRAIGSTYTTISDADQAKPQDRVNRQFIAKAPNQLWVADITYVATWSGFVYVAFVTDVYSRYIVGWRVSYSLETPLVLDALEQAVWLRNPGAGLIHHSDHGSQYLYSLYGTIS